MEYISRGFASIRNRGVMTTFMLAKVKAMACLNLFFPRTIWGERVGLRSVKSALTEQEMELIYNWSREEEILRWSARNPNKLTLDEFKKQVRRKRWQPESDQRDFYILTCGGKLVGQISLYSIDWSNRKGELGIFLDKNYWSQKYGREAIKLYLQYFFSKTPIQSISLGTFSDNVRAQRAFLNSGFRVVGVAKRYNPVVGAEMEGVRMEITRQDYQQNYY
jgi:RimJ/RimL family protein N-acetyltransferase